jgi:hypothetical protein
MLRGVVKKERSEGRMGNDRGQRASVSGLS